MIIAKAMNIDRYDHWSCRFMHECAVHAMKGYWSYMKIVDHSYEQALIMHDNIHIHVIMNIIVTPTLKWLQPKLDGKRSFIAESFLRHPNIDIFIFEKICPLEAENSLFHMR